VASGVSRSCKAVTFSWGHRSACFFSWGPVLAPISQKQHNAIPKATRSYKQLLVLGVIKLSSSLKLAVLSVSYLALDTPRGLTQLADIVAFCRVGVF
jgi:hypothetical protein